MQMKLSDSFNLLCDSLYVGDVVENQTWEVSVTGLCHVFRVH